MQKHRARLSDADMGVRGEEVDVGYAGGCSRELVEGYGRSLEFGRVVVV
jgi:hypothetical protein